MTISTKNELLTLLKGATFLASGGGGPFAFAKTIVESYFHDSDKFTINIVDIDSQNDLKWSVIVAGMAQPSAGIKLTPQAIIEPTVNAVKSMEQLINKNYLTNERFKSYSKFELLCPGEVGAMNVTIPFISAYLLNENIDLVDGDPSGRSVPTIDLGLFGVNQPVMPNMATSQGDDDYQFTVLSLKNYSDLGRAYSNLIEDGLVGIDTGLAMAPMNTKTLKEDNIVKGTLTDAFTIGKIFEEDITAQQRILKIEDYLQNKAQTKRRFKVICKGTVIDYFTETVNSTDLGYITLKTDDKKGNYNILIQNENIIGQFENSISVDVTGPDSIGYISTKDGILEDDEIYENSIISQSFENEENIEIYVVAIEAAPVVKNNEKLMKQWNNAYKTSKYYGPYNSSFWDK
jgi:DUF917 family protein